MVLSTCHGGISRFVVRVLMARAHGRTCSYVISGIGAISPGRWHVTQERCRIGAMSLVKVTCCAAAVAGSAAIAATAHDKSDRLDNIMDLSSRGQILIVARTNPGRKSRSDPVLFRQCSPPWAVVNI